MLMRKVVYEKTAINPEHKNRHNYKFTPKTISEQTGSAVGYNQMGHRDASSHE